MLPRMQLLCHFLAVWLFTFFREGTAAYGAKYFYQFAFRAIEMWNKLYWKFIKINFYFSIFFIVYFSPSSCIYVVLSGCAFEIHFKFMYIHICGRERFALVWEGRSFKVTRLPSLELISGLRRARELWLKSINYIFENNSTLNLTDVCGLSTSACNHCDDFISSFFCEINQFFLLKFMVQGMDSWKNIQNCCFLLTPY